MKRASKVVKQYDTSEARNLGVLAYRRGLRAIPAFDPALMRLIIGRAVGCDQTTAEIDAWLAGWREARDLTQDVA